MVTALGRGNVVDEREHTFSIIARVLNGEFHLNIIFRRLVVNRLRIELFLALVKTLNVVGDTAVKFEGNTIRLAL